MKQIKDIPNDNIMYELAELFKMFSDPTRAKILACLKKNDMYVSDIANRLSMTISAVSHQLRILRSAKLVKANKEGKEVKYSLDDDHVVKIMEMGLSHILEAKN